MFLPGWPNGSAGSGTDFLGEPFTLISRVRFLRPVVDWATATVGISWTGLATLSGSGDIHMMEARGGSFGGGGAGAAGWCSSGSTQSASIDKWATNRAMTTATSQGKTRT